MDLILITKKIEKREMLGKVYSTDINFNGDCWVKHEGSEVGILKGEYITLTEQEAKELLFKNIFGFESKFENDLDTAKDEIEALKAEADQRDDYIRQLEEDLHSATGGR